MLEPYRHVARNRTTTPRHETAPNTGVLPGLAKYRKIGAGAASYGHNCVQKGRDWFGGVLISAVFQADSRISVV